MGITFDRSRRDAILQAAYDVFTTYGFRKSSMDDIARAAGMSRPALYQHFRSKEDIFRAYGARMKDSMVDAVRAAFTAEDSTEDRLKKALCDGFLLPHRILQGTPHGAELIGVKTEIAGDLFDAWIDAMRRAVIEGLEWEEAAGRIAPDRAGLDTKRLGKLIIDAMEGIKGRMVSIDQAETDVADLVALVLAAVRPERR